MKTRTIELNNLQGNALHFSHRQYPFDFVTNPIMFRIYFDGDNYPSIDTASNIVIMDTRQSNMVFVVPLAGDSARIELQATDDEQLNGIEVVDYHIPYLNYPDTTPITRLMENFLTALGIIRGFWGKDFFNRNEAMAAIKHVSEEHFLVLNDFFSAYEAYQNNRVNAKLFKQDRFRWLQIDRQSHQQYVNSFQQLQEFCNSKGISLKGVTYL